MPETRPIFAPDVTVSLAYDTKDARWRVLVELDTGEAYATEDRSLGNGLLTAAAWIKETREHRDALEESLRAYPQRWITGLGVR